jgi:hypothetical protein
MIVLIAFGRNTCEQTPAGLFAMRWLIGMIFAIHYKG